MIHWKNLTDRDLLRIKVNQLDFALEDHRMLRRAVVQIRKELGQRDLLFSPYFWVSDEWYCPDGHSGVAIPFFLLHARLRKLENQFVGEVEGSTFEGLMRLLRHETGHAIDNAFSLRKNKLRQQIFGSSLRRYPKSYRPKLYSDKCVHHLGSAYAQSHPDEDFAETFAVWLKHPKSWWSKKYGNTVAGIKLQFIHQQMSGLKGVKHIKKKWDRPIDPLSDLPITLKEYFSKRRRKYNLVHQIFCQRALTNIFRPLEFDDGQTMDAHDFLKRIEQEVVTKVSQGLGLYKYEVRKVFEPMVLLLRKKDLVIREDFGLSKSHFLDFLTEQSIKGIQKGAFRVSL